MHLPQGHTAGDRKICQAQSRFQQHRFLCREASPPRVEAQWSRSLGLTLPLPNARHWECPGLQRCLCSQVPWKQCLVPESGPKEDGQPCAPEHHGSILGITLNWESQPMACHNSPRAAM